MFPRPVVRTLPLWAVFAMLWSAPSHAIIGGEELKMRMPMTRHVAGITYRDEKGGDRICSGSIIGTHIVLTAAHCVPKNLASVRIVIGETLDHRTAVAVLPVAAARVHPLYETYRRDKQNKSPYDIAVLRTRDPLPAQSRHLQLAASYFPTEQIPTAHVAGFGVTGIDKDGKAVSPEKLHGAIVRRSTKDQSKERLMQTDQTGGTGGCVGDSGGPMLVENADGFILMGIMSTTYNEADDANGRYLCEGVGNFINVHVFREWIVQQASELMQRPR